MEALLRCYVARCAQAMVLYLFLAGCQQRSTMLEQREARTHWAARKASLRSDLGAADSGRSRLASDVTCTTVRAGDVESLIVQVTGAPVNRLEVSSLVFLEARLQNMIGVLHVKRLLVPDFYSNVLGHPASLAAMRRGYASGDGSRNHSVLDGLRIAVADSLEKRGVKPVFLGPRRLVRVRYEDAGGVPDSAFFADVELVSESPRFRRTTRGDWLDHAESATRMLEVGYLIDLRAPSGAILSRFIASCASEATCRRMYH